MIRSIIEAYGLGALSIQQLMGMPKEQEREIIDVEYEDLSDQINDNHSLPRYPSAEEIHLMQSEMGIRFHSTLSIVKIKI